MKNFKKSVLILLLIVTMLFIQSVAYADSGVKILIDGEELTCDVPPVIIDGRTLVPLRAIFEALGAEVDWDEATQTVTALKGDITIILKVNDKYPTINGVVQELDVPATVIDNRTMVPARFIANSMSAQVDWDGDLNIVYIFTQKEIAFKDENLEAVVREQAKIPTGPIYSTDVKNIYLLKAQNAGIEDLSGLEGLTSLQRLDLSNNKIADVSPINSLTNLEELILSNNIITHINNLSNLTKLVTLELNSNKIINFSDIKNLPPVKNLYIQNNPLISLSGIAEFPHNTDFYILKEEEVVNKSNISVINDHEKVLKKAVEIVEKHINDNMTDYEKVLTIHDYLALNTKYNRGALLALNQPEKCHKAYGALIDGEAVCDGYSKAASLLLNLCDVECEMVYGVTFSYSSSPGNHAWNIVKINDYYYHMDITFDDADGDGDSIKLYHEYVNLSDKQISASRFWNKDLYPKCEKDNEDYNNLLNMVRNTIYTDNEIIKIFSKNLYKKDYKSVNITRLTDDLVAQIQLYEDWLYYINETDNNYIYKMKTDGSENTLAYNKSATHIVIMDDLLYFTDIEDVLYRINLTEISASAKKINGAVTSYIFSMNNEWLYYRYCSLTNSRHGINRINNTSNEGSLFIKELAAGFSKSRNLVHYTRAGFERYDDNYVYFIVESPSAGSCLHRANTTTKEVEKLSSDNIENLFFEKVGDYIYYQIAVDSNKNEYKLYRIKTDGTNRTCIENDLLDKK